MPEKQTIKRARRDAAEGKSPQTQAGEFVREEIEHVRQKKHGARSPKQAIAIGLSKARRAGVKLKPPKSGKAPTRRKAEHDVERGQGKRNAARSPKRVEATRKALKKEPKGTTSGRKLAKHARTAALSRSKAQRSASAKKAARTKGPAARSRAAKKAAQTRKRNARS